MNGEAAFERFGWVAGPLGAALADVPLADAVRDSRTHPRWVRPSDPPVDVRRGRVALGWGQRRANGAARRGGPLRRAVVVRHRGLPAQAIHGDLAPSQHASRPGHGRGDLAAGLRTRRRRAFRVQDILAALDDSTALGAPDWPRRTAAFLHGYASIRRLEPAEVAALPEQRYRPVARLRPVVGR